MATSPQFSIDLDAELSKISQRQHLNDVHYLVALVRHSLAHHPNQITVFSQKDQLVFSQDGESLELKEWQALVLLLSREPLQEENQQRALNLLETVYGITLLSIFINFDSVTLTSGHRQIQTAQGRFYGEKSAETTPGYQLVIQRHRTHRKKEETELRFYCAGSAVAIDYNRTSINRPLQLERHLLALDFNTKDGHGSICIPESGELSRFYFFKAGIRVGVKTFSPENGQIVEGYWNVAEPKFESLYHQTIQSGQPLLESYTQTLYRGIRKHFPALTPPFRQRLKKILLAMDPLGWASAYGKIPLFANAYQGDVLCLNDLLRLRHGFQAIPFLGKSKPKTPAFIPVLASEDQYFLGTQLNLPLKPFIGHLQPGSAKKTKSQPPPPNTLSSSQLSPEWNRFLLALNQHSLPMRFRLTAEASYSRERANGLREVWLGHKDANVIAAFQAFCKKPLAAHQWRYRLLAELGPMDSD